MNILTAALVVAGGGFRPQVELSPVGLDLPPGSDHAEPYEGEQQQLLHGVDPFTSPAWNRSVTQARLAENFYAA